MEKRFVAPESARRTVRAAKERTGLASVRNLILLGVLLAAGAVLLTLIFVCILLPMILFHALVGAAELPMLSLAYSLTPVLGLIYAVLLFAGMFTAALSSLFAITTRVQQRTGGALISRRFISLLCALAFVGSIFGFKNVVSFVYPICGYIGFFALAGILLHFFLLRRSGVGAGS